MISTQPPYKAQDSRPNPELSTEEKLVLRLKHLPPGKCLKYIVITGTDGEVLAYCETEIGKSVSGGGH